MVFARIALALALAAALPDASSSVGKATRVVPRVEIQHASQTSRLSVDDPVADNDRIRSAVNGRARIALNDGSILSVGSASELTVRADVAAKTNASRVDVTYGRIRALVAPRHLNGPFEIHSKTAIAGVLGTIVFMDATSDVTRVANLSDDTTSRVRVTSVDPSVKGEVILMPGEGTAVPAKRPPQ